MPITDNILIEKLLGKYGIICLEDIIDSLLKCSNENSYFNEVKSAMWPIQLAPRVEEISKAHIKHDATGSEMQKKTTTVARGGYLGLMGEEINNFVKSLI